MNGFLNKLKRIATTRPEMARAVLIGLGCLVLYLLNQETLSSNDNVPNSLLAFNLLENHTLHFDAFRNSELYGAEGVCIRCPDGTPYYFAETQTGYLASSYPIGSAVVTFPLYVVFYLLAKIQLWVQGLLTGVPAVWPDMTTAEFSSTRRLYEKLAGSIITAMAAALFYRMLRLKFSRTVAYLCTAIFAVGTTSWVICAQGLTQHTVSNFLVIGVLYCLLQANRHEGRSRYLYLWVAGLCCGLLPVTRITSGLFAVVAGIYAIATYRKEVIWLFLGLPTVLIHLFWNLYYFGPDNLIRGGYTRLIELGYGSYDYSWNHFAEAFVGSLVSPNDGLLIFSPVLIFSGFGVYQAWHHRHTRDEPLLFGLAIACLLLFINYCFFVPWTGGNDSYGPRYTTDLLPVLCFFIAYFVAHEIYAGRDRSRRLNILFLTFLISLGLSIGIFTIGAFSKTSWGTVPARLGADESRIWDWRDSQIRRHFNSMVYHLFDPVPDPETYLQQSRGTIQALYDDSGNPLSRLSVTSGRSLILRADLQNTGETRWIGYQSGMIEHETRISVDFLDSTQQEVATGARNRLFVSGMPQPGDTAEAIGLVVFPKQPGTYQMTLHLILEGEGEFLDAAPYSIPVAVRKKPNKPNNA